VLGALTDPYCRQLLLAPIEHNPRNGGDPDPLNIHPEGHDALAKLNILMRHLPKLEDMRIIE
jgi:hypothetical protein